MIRFGKLEPRYAFAVNPHRHYRATKCPRCHGKTFKRKFPLLVMSKYAPAIALGFTSVYCAKCEIIIVHKEEFEKELFLAFNKANPIAKNHEYFVVGTMLKEKWKLSLERSNALQDMQEYVSDFREHISIEQREV